MYHTTTAASMSNALLVATIWDSITLAFIFIKQLFYRTEISISNSILQSTSQTKVKQKPFVWFQNFVEIILSCFQSNYQYIVKVIPYHMFNKA